MTAQPHPVCQHLTEGEIAAMGVPAEDAATIIAEVASAARITVSQLLGHSHVPRFAWPRQAAYLALHRAGYSKSDISRIMKRDHGAVSYGIKRAQARAVRS